MVADCAIEDQRVPQWVDTICERFASTMETMPGIDYHARVALLNPSTLRLILTEEMAARNKMICALFWHDEETLKGIGKIIAIAHIHEAGRTADTPQPFPSLTANRRTPPDDARAKNFLRATLHTLQHHPDIGAYIRDVFSFIQAQLLTNTGVPEVPWLLRFKLLDALSSVALLHDTAFSMLTELRMTMNAYVDRQVETDRAPYRKVPRGERPHVHSGPSDLKMNALQSTQRLSTCQTRTRFDAESA